MKHLKEFFPIILLIIIIPTICFIASRFVNINPDFKEGDCLAYNWDKDDYEEWEWEKLDFSIKYKVFRVGKRKYMLRDVRYFSHYKTETFGHAHLLFKKIDCN